jgi:hypothetical protein
VTDKNGKGDENMAVIYCDKCDRYIDLDWNVEHEDECGVDFDEDEE